MNQKILVAIVVLLVIGGIYWVSIQKNGNNNGTVATSTSTSTVSSTFDLVVNGPIGIVSGLDGKYLTNLKGMTLYVNVKDQGQTGPIKASCNASCETTWVPFLMDKSAVSITKSTDPLLSKLNVFTRVDGEKQYALGTNPLYTNVNDTKPGETKGSIGAEWMVAQP